MFDFLSKAGSSVMDGLSSVGSSVADGVQSGLTHTFEKLQDPEFMQQVGLMSAALSNDQNRYQSALNAYDSRRQEIAKQKREDVQRAQAREEKLEDLKASHLRQDTIRAEDRTFKVEDRNEQREYDGEVRQEGYDRQDYVYGRGRADTLADRKSRTQVIDGVMYEEFGPNDWRPVAGGSDGSGAQGDGAQMYGDLDLNKLPLGLVELDGQYVVVEETTKGRKIRTPQKFEIETYGLDKLQEAGSDSYIMQKLSPYIDGSKDIPSSQANFTGSTTEAPLGADWISRIAGGEERELYSYLDLMDAQGTLKGIESARSAGASGINSPAEFETFKKGFPAIDRSSPENLKASLLRQQDYITAHNQKEAKKKARFQSFNSKKQESQTSAVNWDDL